MATWLTLFYTASVFMLLLVAAALLYFGLERSMRREDRDFLSHKMQVLTTILQRRPLDRAGLDQEVLEEAEISSHSQAPFSLRVLERDGQVIVETPGMAAQLPPSVFPQARSGEAPSQRWRSSHELRFLLASMQVPSAAATQPAWHIQAALNVSAEERLLQAYRRDIALVLVAGLLLAAAIGAWITRRGLRPLADITRTIESIGVQELQERIVPGPWPQELVSLAGSFDRMLDRLQESFERLSQFSADLAHELRTPINNLMGEAQVALSRSRSAPEYARVLHSALEEHARLARMIDSMLFLAQADRARTALAPVALDARAELQAVADFYQALADEQGVELVCEGSGSVMADAMLLRRALSNLLSNALKYTSRGGCVTLRAVPAVAGEPAVLSVIDSGSGIPVEHLPKLGDRFYRVDPARTESFRGAGLGLAIVKSIMSLHGGSFVIASTEGQGTTASLVFSAG